MKKERGEAFTTFCTIQSLQNYGLCGILNIEKDNRPQRWVAELVKKNPLRARQSQGGGFSMSVTFLLFVLKNERK